MSIEKLRKIRLIVPRPQKDEVLRELMLMGCVELFESDELLSDPSVTVSAEHETDELSALRSDFASLSHALYVLSRWVPVKNRLFPLKPEISQDELFDDSNTADCLELAKNLEKLDDRLHGIQIDTANELRMIESLTPWADFDLPLDTDGTISSAVIFGTIPLSESFDELCAALRESAPESHARIISAGSELKYISVIYLRELFQAVTDTLAQYDFAQSPLAGMHGTAAENIDACKARLLTLETEKTDIISKIVSRAEIRAELALCCDRTGIKITCAEASEKLAGTVSTVILSGWARADIEPELITKLSRYGCAWELTDPLPEELEDMPVLQSSNRFTRPLAMIINTLCLPAYKGVDPSPLTIPFFVLFCGIMMSDMGYGLIMISAGLVFGLKTSLRENIKQFFKLMAICGVSTFITGALTGSFFGDAPLLFIRLINPDTAWQGLPCLLSPLDNTLTILVCSLALGFLQIITGMAISFINRVRRGEIMAALCGDGAWFAVFLLFAAAVYTKMWTYCMLAVLVLLLLTQGCGKKGITEKVIGVVSSVYTGVTCYFGGVLSYLLLAALMLAGFLTTRTFNTIGYLTGNIVSFFIISLTGNALGFLLKLLGGLVHNMRLQRVEYLGRFIEDGGRPFRPLAIKTIYHDIVKD